MATVTCSGLLRVGRLAAPAVEGEEGRRRKLERLKFKIEIKKDCHEKRKIIPGLLDQITVFTYKMDIFKRKFATEHHYFLTVMCSGLRPLRVGRLAALARAVVGEEGRRRNYTTKVKNLKLK
jgi:hypothetical protein